MRIVDRIIEADLHNYIFGISTWLSSEKNLLAVGLAACIKIVLEYDFHVSFFKL